jgi:hypothetical protein
MKLIRDDWAIMLIRKISRDWEWALIPMGIGPRKKIEGSRAFQTKEEARDDALRLAINCGLKIYSPNIVSLQRPLPTETDTENHNQRSSG